ncbi:MAG: DUF3427 domain-containing protein [Clostridiales bacterium]|nr:DUF3427 domain-containing protein [Clostridiales bacterium]
MKTGLYEEIVSGYLKLKLDAIDDNRKDLKLLSSVDSEDYLAQYLYRVIAQGLSQVKNDKDLDNKTDKQISICNEIISVLNNNKIDVEGHEISETAQRLMSIMDEVITYQKPRPDTPLALGALLTGTRQDPSLVSQLKKEITSCDTVDILCSFIRWTGIVILREALEEFTSNPNNRLRIITTSYMGATETKAIEYLSNLNNTEVKISYDTRRTRLHAKAYLFQRHTGFSIAYIGSSNISSAALTDGLEWNVKISQYEQPFQWDKIRATFETYWHDSEFENFKKGDGKKLEKALVGEKSSGNTHEFIMPNFDFIPYPFQKEILEGIQAERELQQRKKHLIVAATGTGKTMIAAFDFKSFRKRFIENFKREPRLMFIAHREEILNQSLYSFRGVLRDQNYGDKMVGGNMPSQMEQIFVSIQTYNSRKLYEQVEANYYDYVVVDEFHHAAAPSYRTLLEHINPQSLLGLTATPERADGLEIKHYFDDHISAEIRLPDAIDRKLLSPFQYFGITDSVDYSQVKWQRGGYVTSELTNIYTGDDRRADMILEKTIKTVLDIKRVKGLGFCVSQAHAEFMSRKFNGHGVPSEYLTSNSDKEIRSTVQKRLLSGDINFIFVVDLYNEGVDIPEVDTVLFLRPTESLTVFLQQLGRGLRLVDGKDCLTVLDFVGQANKNYRYDLKYRALIEGTNQSLDKELADGFPHLPAGCSIELERKSKEYILDNIKQAIRISKGMLVNQIYNFTSNTGKNLTFERFLEYYKLSPIDLYKRTSWSRALVDAEMLEDFSENDEGILLKGMLKIAHIDDISYIRFILTILEKGDVEVSNLEDVEKRYCIMFFLTIFNKQKFESIEDAYLKLLDNPVMCEELAMLLKYKMDNIKLVSPTLELPFDCALKLHCQYTQVEVLAGLDFFTLQKNHTVQSGVLHIKAVKTDIFFITLSKNDNDYSPTTMYKDYAISESLFHWQSQSNTRELSKTGQRYINQKATDNTILLFVREYRNIGTITQPYYFLGPVDYISHEGEKPISFVWKMRYPMPAHLVRATARLSIG